MRSARFQGGGFRSLRKYQGGWVQIIYWLVALIITIVLAPKPATPRAAAIEDFDLPVAEADRPIPVLFGRKRITGANVLWYGDLRTSKIKKRSLFSSSTVGYKYYLAMHMGFCLGPIDAFHAIDIGDKRAWTGNQTDNGFGGISQPDLFGGEKREGGIQGTIHFRFGAADQEADEYLSIKIPQPMPAFRGIACIIFNSFLFGFGGGGGYVGTTPYVKPWAVTASRILKGWHNDTVWYPERANVNGGMNAAHIIYQCLTDPEWGMGAPVGLVDDTNFRTLADTCFNEGLGLNLLWNQTTTIEDFVQIVLDHIAGGLGFDPATGKYIVTLIRGDYVPATLPLFDNSNMGDIQDFQRRAWAETVNELAITYTDATTGKSVPIVVQDLGNIRSQSARIPDKIDRTGITSLDVIRVVAGRELASRSTPLARIDFTANRKGWNVHPYGVIRITRTEPEMHLNETVFRVVDIKKGNLERGTITISAIEDIYALSGIEYGEEQPAEPDADPILPPDDGPDVSGTVTSTTTTAPPDLTSLTDGQRFLVPAGATGEWAGHAGQIAEWDEDEEQWFFIDVPDGATIYDDESGEDVQVYGGVAEPKATGRIVVVGELNDPDETVDPTDMLIFADATVEDLGTGGARIKVLPSEFKGDLVLHDGTKPVRFPVGPDFSVLMADASQAYGVQWSTIAAGDGSIVYADGSTPGGNTIANTAAETTFESQYEFDTSLLQVGYVLRGKIYGTFGTDSVAPTLRIRIKMGGTTVLDTAAATMTASLTGRGWSVEFAMILMVAGSGGQIYAQGEAMFATAANDGRVVFMPNTANISVNMSLDTTLTVTAQWGAADADNTITLRQMLLFAEAVDFIPPLTTVVLLHLNGSNGSTTFTDVMGHTWTGAGNAQISNATVVADQEALLLDGTGDWIESTSVDYVVGTNDFTFQCWARWESSFSGNRFIFTFGAGSGWGVYTFGGQLAVFNGGASNVIIGGAASLNTNYHIALCREGTNLRLFVNGTQAGSTATDSTNHTNQTIRIGAQPSGAGAMIGRVDEFKMDHEALYTANFTPPTPPFADP